MSPASAGEGKRHSRELSSAGSRVSCAKFCRSSTASHRANRESENIRLCGATTAFAIVRLCQAGRSFGRSGKAFQRADHIGFGILFSVFGNLKDRLSGRLWCADSQACQFGAAIPHKVLDYRQKGEPFPVMTDGLVPIARKLAAGEVFVPCSVGR